MIQMNSVREIWSIFSKKIQLSNIKRTNFYSLNSFRFFSGNVKKYNQRIKFNSFIVCKQVFIPRQVYSIKEPTIFYLHNDMDHNSLERNWISLNELSLLSAEMDKEMEIAANKPIKSTKNAIRMIVYDSILFVLFVDYVRRKLIKISYNLFLFH